MSKKFYENENWEEQVDGSTIEKRRDQRAEILERYLGSLTDEDRQGVVGKVNQYMKATGVQVVPAEQSVYDLTSKTKKVREAAVQHQFEELPPIVKRTPQERIESMVQRLKTAPAWQTEFILKEIGSEYWRMGMPVSTEDLRTVAAHFLNQAERRK